MMRTKLLLTILGAAFVVAVSQAQVTNLWNDTAPSGGTMNLTTLNVGGTHGVVGVFSSSTQTSTNEISSYSSAGQDWSAFAGLDWTMTADIYITSAQLADGAVSEDEISYEVGGLAGGNLTLSNAVWWTPDAWNTVYFTGTFDTDVSNLTNATAAFVNNDQTNHPAGDNYLLDNLNLDVEVRETKWDDQAPTGGNMELLLIADPFGTGHGDIGEYQSATGGQWQNYGSGAQNLAANAGQKWKLSFEVYITSAQLADAAITDDNIYYQVAGNAGGFTTINSAGWVADSWNTVVWAGTLSSNPDDLASAQAFVLVNDQETHPDSGASYYFDNFKFEVQPAAALPTDVLWTDTAPAGGGMGLTLVTNAYGTGIGEYESSTDATQFSDYGTTNNVWSNYAGQGWTMTCDIYLPSAQAGDTNVTDDAIYYQVAGDIGGWIDVDTVPADEWTTLTWNGAFTNAPGALTSVSALIVNNNQLTHPAGVNYYLDNFKFEATVPQVVGPEMDTLWNDQNPVGGNAEFVQISDPFGTGQGNIGVFDSDANPNQYSNYNINHVDWGAYVGLDWTLTADVYITAVQLADAAISDDIIYYSVGGMQGGETSVSSLIPDSWNTLTWTGTFTNDALALADASCLFLNNDQGTQPAAGVNYCVDNFLLKAVAPVVTDPPPPTIDVTNTVEFVAAGEGFTDGPLNGQKNWAASANWTVDTASGGSVSCTNNNSNMTLVQLKPLVEGKTFQFTFNLKVNGAHAPVGGNSYVYAGRIGMTTDSDGSNQGYNGGANDPAPNWAQSTFQANNSTPYSYRVYGDGWNGPQTPFIPGSGSNDIWAIHYSITMGDSPENTDFRVDLENVTTEEYQAMDAVEEGIGETLYNALEAGTAYLYFETGGFDYGVTGVEVLSVETVYPEPQVDKYILWANAAGLSGANALTGSDPDQDGLNNWGEYVFDGNPRAFWGDDDQGTQPVLDPDTLIYTYSLRGDPFVEAKVLTTENLLIGWTVSDTVPVTETNGELNEYNFDASGYNHLFLKLEVSRDL